MTAFLTDIKRKLETGFDVFGAKTVRALVAEIDALKVESELHRVALADKIDECAAKDEALTVAREALKVAFFYVEGKEMRAEIRAAMDALEATS